MAIFVFHCEVIYLVLLRKLKRFDQLIWSMFTISLSTTLTRMLTRMLTLTRMHLHYTVD